MDELEKTIFRRRRADLAESLEVTRELLQEMRSCGLLTFESVAVIELEKTPSAKMDRLIDTVISLGPADGFQTLCRILSRVSRSLSADMEAELGLERGEIQPRPEMIQEAAILVQRKFGSTKRFSEADRREVTELIAAKLQLAHDEWRREADKVQGKLDDVRDETRQMDERGVRVAALLADFTRKYEQQILSHATDLAGTRSLLKRMSAGATNGNTCTFSPGGKEGGSEVVDTLADLQRNMKDFFKQVSIILDHRDNLYNEKERCLRLLKVTDDKVQLDEVVGRITGLSITANMGVEKKDTIISRLKDQVVALDREANDYEQTLEGYRRQMAEKEREIATLRRSVQID